MGARSVAGSFINYKKKSRSKLPRDLNLITNFILANSNQHDVFQNAVPGLQHRQQVI